MDPFAELIYRLPLQQCSSLPLCYRSLHTSTRAITMMPMITTSLGQRLILANASSVVWCSRRAAALGGRSLAAIRGSPRPGSPAER